MHGDVPPRGLLRGQAHLHVGVELVIGLLCCRVQAQPGRQDWQLQGKARVGANASRITSRHINYESMILGPVLTVQIKHGLMA